MNRIARMVGRVLCFFRRHGGSWGGPIILVRNVVWNGDTPIQWQSGQFQRKLCPYCGLIQQRKLSDETPMSAIRPSRLFDK